MSYGIGIGISAARTYGVPLVKSGYQAGKRLLVGATRSRAAATAANGGRGAVLAVPKVNVAVDSVMVPFIVADDFLTSEPLIESELGNTVKDLYMIYSFARLGGAGIGMAKKASATAKVVSGRASRVASSANTWVKHFPLPQGVLKVLREAKPKHLHRTWNKTFDVATKTWHVTTKSGTELLRYSKDGVKANSKYLGKLTLAGGTATGAAMLFGENEDGETTEFTADDIETIDQYLDTIVAGALESEPEDDQGDGELYRILTFPSSVFNEIAWELDLPPSSSIVASAVGEAVMNALENPNENEISIVDSSDDSPSADDSDDGDDETASARDEISRQDFRWG